MLGQNKNCFYILRLSNSVTLRKREYLNTPKNHQFLHPEMDVLEQQLIDIDDRMYDAIQKQKLSVAETIHRVAEDSINACMTLNDEFRDIFPELANLEPELANLEPEPKTSQIAQIMPYEKAKKAKKGKTSEDNTTAGTANTISPTIPQVVKIPEPQNGFNPTFVIEIKDGKGCKIIDTWDKTTGLLPDRKVMCKYYIDVGKDFEFFHHSQCNMYCVTHNKNITRQGGHELHGNHTASNVFTDCGCSNFYNNITNHLYGVALAKPTTAQITRGEHRPLLDTKQTHEFEIDNYLNLYHPSSGLYLLFNKTAFPAFPFLARPQVFQSKRITGDETTMQFKFDLARYKSHDARPGILAAVPELIPDDYYKVIDFYDRFRQMTNYKRGLRQLGTRNLLFESKTTREIDTEFGGEELPPSGQTDIRLDTRDKLILELESRLSGCLKQIELTDDYNRELVDLFTKQSAEVLDLTRRLNQQTADKQTTETAKRLSENHEIFALKKQLADAQSYIARCQMLGGDITRLETELSNSQLDTQKYKDLAQGLTDQLLGVKRELRDKSTEHATGIKTATRDMSRIAGLEKDNTRMTTDNLALQNKVRNLEAQILAVNTNSKPEKEALEQVLITKCDELTRDRDELSRKYSELVKVNKQLERDYEEFRGSITKLMTGR